LLFLLLFLAFLLDACLSLAFQLVLHLSVLKTLLLDPLQLQHFGFGRSLQPGERVAGLRCVGAANVLVEGDLSAYQVDWRQRWRGKALAVVRPGNDGADAGLIDAGVADLAAYLAPGDALVFNNTRVIPAALRGPLR